MTVGRTCGRCGHWQFGQGVCRECERRRVLAYVDRKKEELGEWGWLDLKAERQRERRDSGVGRRYDRARSRAIAELVRSRPDEFRQLRAAAVADGKRNPYDAARSALARRYRDAVSERTRQLRRAEGARSGERTPSTGMRSRTGTGTTR